MHVTRFRTTGILTFPSGQEAHYGVLLVDISSLLSILSMSWALFPKRPLARRPLADIGMVAFLATGFDFFQRWASACKVHPTCVRAQTEVTGSPNGVQSHGTETTYSHMQRRRQTIQRACKKYNTSQADTTFDHMLQRLI